MSEPITPTSAPKSTPAVIRRLESAAETSQERLIRKHLPAWVISGAVNVGLVAVLLLLGARTPPAQAVNKILDTTAERQDTPPEQSLTNEDSGIQSNIEASLPDLQRLADKTADAAVTQDNIGQPDVPANDIMGLQIPGLTTLDVTAPGVKGNDSTALSGKGGMMGNSLSSMPGRSGATKSQLLKEGGGNELSERAVARGLAWLARQQKKDGSWIYDGAKTDEIVAATGMCLLPFLGAGETHKSGRYAKTIRSGLEFLILHCPLNGPNAGKFSKAGDMYAQAIGTLALCEAYGMTKDKILLPTAQAAINYIQRAQGANGSWGYQSGETGDTSIVGWQIQALQAGRLSKEIVVDKKVIDNAIRFLNAVSAGPGKSAYGYATKDNAQAGTALTAVGLLCRYYIDGWGPDNGGMAEGVKGLMGRTPTVPKDDDKKPTSKKDEPNPPPPDMYFYYYATQVVHFFAGDEWRTWNEGKKEADGSRRGGMRDLLIKTQNKKGGAIDGSWNPEGGFIGRQCGRLGTTAMCLLTLEVYYRHLPLYKRSSADVRPDVK